MKRTLKTIKVAGFIMLAMMAFTSCNNDEHDHDHDDHHDHHHDHPRGPATTVTLPKRAAGASSKELA